MTSSAEFCARLAESDGAGASFLLFLICVDLFVFYYHMCFQPAYDGLMYLSLQIYKVECLYVCLFVSE